MDRELLLGAMILLVCGPLISLGGVLSRRQVRTPARTQTERLSWLRLWLPLMPAATLFALLLGWFSQEPDPADELLQPHVLAAMLPFGLIWLRAAVRAVSSLTNDNSGTPAATVGLWKPRIVLSPDLMSRLDEHARAAVLEHERAHARHRDPLRIWSAQIATDLQWPMSAARRRFQAWRTALEIRRDAEACGRGVDGADLAHALIVASRMHRPTRHSAAAPLVGEGSMLGERIACLLGHGAVGDSNPPLLRVVPVAAALLLLAATILGFAFGDNLVLFLPGITR